MTEQEIILVQKSWTQIRNHSQDIGEAFYEKLFDKRPDLKNLFSTNKEAQAKKLMSAMALAVTKLYQDSVPDETIEAVGKRHTAYRVKPEYFAVFGEVLIETLGERLGDFWTDELEKAWIAAYEHIAKMMMQTLR